MARTMAREAAFMLLYEKEMGSGREDTLKDLIAPQLEYRVTKSDAAYIESVLEGVWEKRGEIDALIEEHAKHWSAHRIPRVEFSLLRLAAFELMDGDVPDAVAINEAVELAKKYAGEEAAVFVNGVLGAIFQSVVRP